HRLERHVDREPVRDHVDASPNADTTARSSSASNPASTRTTAPPTSTEIVDRDIELAGTNFAKVGAPACRAACIHRYPIDVSKPSRPATSFTEAPVARTSST